MFWAGGLSDPKDELVGVVDCGGAAEGGGDGRIARALHTVVYAS